MYANGNKCLMADLVCWFTCHYLCGSPERGRIAVKKAGNRLTVPEKKYVDWIFREMWGRTVFGGAIYQS